MRFKSETRSSNPVKPALVTIATKMKTKCSKLSHTTTTNIRPLGKITSIQTCGSVCLGSHHLISSSYYCCVLVGDRRQHYFILLGWPTWLRQSLVRGTFLHIIKMSDMQKSPTYNPLYVGLFCISDILMWLVCSTLSDLPLLSATSSYHNQTVNSGKISVSSGDSIYSIQSIHYQKLLVVAFYVPGS